MPVKKDDGKAVWETWVMDAGTGKGPKFGKKEGEEVGIQYDSYSEDGRLRGLVRGPYCKVLYSDAGN